MERKIIRENQLLLPNGEIITFNDEQKAALKKINEWSFNEKNIFTLGGFAGTGKTTVIKKFLDEYSGGVVVSAPTHKAKKVIMNKTKKDGLTMQSLLGLRPDINLDDFNPNDPQFNPIAPPKINDYNLVVIDEASMINEDLYQKILKLINQKKTKILFMGDPAQIPPIGEKESVVFKNNEKEIFWLTKIERQSKDNPLTEIYSTLRENLEKEDVGFKRTTKLNDKGEGVIFTVNKREFRKLLFEKLSSDEYKNDSDYCKLIGWKNDTVNKSNEIIRKKLFENSDEMVLVGDVLMAYRTVTTMLKRGRFKTIIENSVDYRVISRSKLIKNKHNIFGYDVTLRETISKNKYKFINAFIIDTNDYENLHNYAKIHDFLKETAKQNKKLWSDYYSFRKDNILMKTIDKQYKSGYRKADQIIVKDMDYGYSITSHKSQGSTYNHVFIMENDINDNWVTKERNQIKYVSFTRPTTSAVVLTTKLDF